MAKELRIINHGDPEAVFAWRMLAAQVNDVLIWEYLGSAIEHGIVQHAFSSNGNLLHIVGRGNYIADEAELIRLSQVGKPAKLQQASCVMVIHPESGFVLATSRRGHNDQLGFPGGKQDEGEDSLTCAVREFEEEVGVRLELPPVLLDSEIDSTGYMNNLYVVTNRADIYRVCQLYDAGSREMEPGIFVSFVPYWKLMSGPFSEFNQNLLAKLMLKFLNNNDFSLK